MSDSKTYWNNLIDEAREISKEYESALCSDLLMVVITELENKYQKERNLYDE